MTGLAFMTMVLYLLEAPTYFYYILYPIWLIEYCLGFFMGTLVGNFITRNS